MLASFLNRCKFSNLQVYQSFEISRNLICSNSNIQASVMVIAAKASDEIIQLYDGQQSGANINSLNRNHFFIVLVVILTLHWSTE